MNIFINYQEISAFIERKFKLRPTFSRVDNLLKFSDDGKTVIGVKQRDVTHIIIPNGVMEIGVGAFHGCESRQSIDVPNSVTKIGIGAFYGCSSLQSIDIPNSVTEIGGGAFIGCKSLQGIDIPNRVTAIGIGAFYGCESLQSIDIPNRVTEIGGYALRGCKSLQSIHLHWTQLDDIQVYKYSFSGLNTEECILYVPSGTRWEYRHHPAFSKFKNIEIEKKKP